MAMGVILISRTIRPTRTWKRLSMAMATDPKRTGSFSPKKRHARIAAM
jgi:hypothetical protein